MRFSLIDTQNNINISFEQIFDLFDVKRKGVVDFGDFVRVLNVFHPNASQEEKIDCMFLRFTQSRSYMWTVVYVYSWLLYSFSSIAVTFRLYDLDGTGFIERDEVYCIFHSLYFFFFL